MTDIKKVLFFKVYDPHAPEVYLYRFELMMSNAFKYGNGTGVAISRDGEMLGYSDTRYDKQVINDFRSWCVTWIYNHHSSDTQFEESGEYMEVFYCV